jgi:hypothetical protein
MVGRMGMEGERRPVAMREVEAEVEVEVEVEVEARLMGGNRIAVGGMGEREV